MRIFKYLNLAVIFSMILLIACQPAKQKDAEDGGWKSIRVSDNGRYFQYEDGSPFFWLGDTGWLLFRKADREGAEKYLSDRAAKGYNVIQVMGLHNTDVLCFNGTPALIDENVSKPNILDGNDPNDSTQYDYWDHVEYCIDLAREKGMFIGFVPIWGSPVGAGKVTADEAKKYAEFLVERFGDKPNIIWLNGGDIQGDKGMDVWQAIGNTIDSLDQDRHLITFHPRGRRMSSEWFHNESWLDFNMFQSGHRHYDQDTARDSWRFGPDNWRYIEIEYAMSPAKPTLDGEPSYEGIPYGLHDANNPYWEAPDIRRYAYWSVFAGGAGFTYGHNSVMQFYQEGDTEKAFGAREYWQEGITHPGAEQMQYLKKLMESRSYFDRMPDQSVVMNNGERYYHVRATRGKDYVMAYLYMGQDITLDLSVLESQSLKASWYDPTSGAMTDLGTFTYDSPKTFDPPGEMEEGNDWVLIVEKV